MWEEVAEAEDVPALPHLFAHHRSGKRTNESLIRPDLGSWCATATKTPFVLQLEALNPLEQKCVGNLSQPVCDLTLVFS